MKAFKTEDLYEKGHSIAERLIFSEQYPWQILPKIHDWILAVGPTLPADRFDHPKEDVWIAKSAHVFASAYIGGPCIIDEDAEIRQCAFIRGNAVVGKNTVVGNSTELKNVILSDNVQVPHYNYVGDSVLGYKSHMGAGSITSNVKSDKKLVVIHTGEEDIATGMKKIGAMLGDWACSTRVPSSGRIPISIRCPRCAA